MPERTSSSGARIGLLAAVALCVAACAAPMPMVVNSSFADRAPTAAAKAVPGPACRLTVAEVIDGRRAPDMLGIVSGRAIKSPSDPHAWLQSILGGLATRGVSVDFDKDAVPTADSIVAKVRLQSAWLTDTKTNKTANVVLHVEAERAGSTKIERDYRGSLSTINWSGGVGETQRLVDDAFAEALNDMAADFYRLCVR